jgi:hypothetical protein
MRKKVTPAGAETALERILDALKQELIDASDREIHEAARELGMDLAMKASAAYAGLTYPSKAQLMDFFEFEAVRQVRLAAERSSVEPDNGQPLRSRIRRKPQRARHGQPPRSKKDRH